MNTNRKIRLLIINEHLIHPNLKQASSFIFFVVFLCSLASSLAVLLSSLVIMTVFGLNCCPPASPTSAQLFIELHSSSIPLHLSLLLSPSLYLHLFLCRHRPHLDGSALFFFQLFCPLRSSPHSIDQSLPLSVSTPPSNLLSCSFSYYCLLNSALY